MGERDSTVSNSEDAATAAARKEFEDWAVDRSLSLESEMVGNLKFYKSKLTRTAWGAWNTVRIRLTVAPIQYECGHCGKPVLSGSYHVCEQMLEHRRNTTMRSAAITWPHGGK